MESLLSQALNPPSSLLAPFSLLFYTYVHGYPHSLHPSRSQSFSVFATNWSYLVPLLTPVIHTPVSPASVHSLAHTCVVLVPLCECEYTHAIMLLFLLEGQLLGVGPCLLSSFLQQGLLSEA